MMANLVLSLLLALSLSQLGLCVGPNCTTLSVEYTGNAFSGKPRVHGGCSPVPRFAQRLATYCEVTIVGELSDSFFC